MTIKTKSLIVAVLLQTFAGLWWHQLQRFNISSLFSLLGAYENHEFGMRSIDLNTTAPCGAHKCFFRSKEDPDIGFLVVESDPNRDENLQEQWNANAYLKEKYKRSSFLLAPPSEHSIPQEFASQMNEISIGGDNRYSGNNSVLVLTVQRAPKSSMLIGCHIARQYDIMHGLDDFMDSFVGDKELFLRQLKRQLKSAIQVMEAEPWYARDWQAMMHADGKLIDIDVAEIDDENTIDRDGISLLDWIDRCCGVFEDIYEQAVQHSIKHFKFQDKTSFCSTKLHSLPAGALDASKPLYCKEKSGGCLYETSENPQVGYLVANSTKAGRVLKSNADIGSWLTKEFKIRHNVLGPPEPVGKKLLGASITRDNFRNAIWLVQKLKRFPSRVIRFTCSEELTVESMFDSKVASFLRHIKDFRKFKNKVKAEVKKITKMTQAGNQSLVPNFRAVIDAKGYVYLLDLHRVLQKNEDTTSAKCLEAIESWGKEVWEGSIQKS